MDTLAVIVGILIHVIAPMTILALSFRYWGRGMPGDRPLQRIDRLLVAPAIACAWLWLSGIATMFTINALTSRGDDMFWGLQILAVWFYGTPAIIVLNWIGTWFLRTLRQLRFFLYVQSVLIVVLTIGLFLWQ